MKKWWYDENKGRIVHASEVTAYYSSEAGEKLHQMASIVAAAASPQVHFNYAKWIWQTNGALEYRRSEYGNLPGNPEWAYDEYTKDALEKAAEYKDECIEVMRSLMAELPQESFAIDVFGQYLNNKEM